MEKSIYKYNHRHQQSTKIVRRRGSRLVHSYTRYLQIQARTLDIRQYFIYLLWIYLLLFFILIEKLLLGTSGLETRHHTKISANNFKHLIKIIRLFGRPFSARDLITGFIMFLSNDSRNILNKGRDGTSIPCLTISVKVRELFTWNSGYTV